MVRFASTASAKLILGAGAEEGGLIGSLTAPLIPSPPAATKSTTSTIDSADDPDDNVSTRSGSSRFVTVAIVTLLTAGGIAASAVAMISVQSVAMYVAGGVCILNSSWMAVKQFQLAKGGGVRQKVNQMRKTLSLLQEEGKLMKGAVDDLQEEVECLHDIEEELDAIARDQGWKSGKIVALVNENESILAAMKNNLREVALAEITRLILSSDKNGDMKINLKELNILTLRIRLALEQRGVDFDEEQFTAMVRKDNDIAQVLAVVAAIMFDEKIDDREIDEYAEEAISEMKRQDALTGSLIISGAFLVRLRRLAGAVGVDEDEHIDETPMFMIQEGYTRGSVDMARGTRVTLSRHTKGTSTRTNQIIRKTVQDINRIRSEGLERGKAERGLAYWI